MKKIAIALTAWLFASAGFAATAQIVESIPSPLQQSSQGVAIIYHADKGTAGLKGLTSGVYAHTGVITNKSDGSWVYAPTWGDNSEKYALVYTGPDTWRLNIGDIRTYYGITDPDEKVEKIALVFRNADKTKEGKGDGGSDIFIDVYDDVFAFEMTASDGPVLMKTGTVRYTMRTTESATISLKVNDDVVSTKQNVVELSVPVNFAEAGAYTVVATADNGKETLEKTVQVLVAPKSEQVDYPGGTPRQGAVKNADGTVTFCLAAPMKENVILVGSWNDYAPATEGVMNYQNFDGQRYFWTTVSLLKDDESYPYYYLVDGKTKVADPYATLILDPYSDKWLETDLGNMPKYPYTKFDDTVLAVYRGSLDDYEWQITDFTIPAHDALNIYELLIRDFHGESSKADGTLKALRGSLSYLQTLGINAIELMPIMEFNGNNSWGYNTNFYFAPDKAYGSPLEFKEFIDDCHRHGIAVILDVVFNQSDGLHPWYQMYNIKENPFYNETAPHAYSVLNDWRQDYPLVERQWHDVLAFWLKEYNVDGFRFDLVKGLGDNDSYKGISTDSYNKSRVERMTRLHATIESVKPGAIHINEHLAGAQEENEMAADGQLNWANINNASCQFAMGYESESNMNRFYAPLDGNRLAGSTVSYAESHDEERMGYKQTQWGNSAAIKSNVPTRTRRLGSVAAQMLMTPGSHMIWQFAELGADETTKKSDGGNNTDPKKVLWNRLNDDNYLGLHDTYKRLLWTRLNNPSLFSAEADVTVSLSAWAKGRFVKLTNGNDELVLLVNPLVDADLEVSTAVSKIAADNCQVLAASHEFTPEVKAEGGNVSCVLPAGAFVVVATKSATEIGSIEDDMVPQAVAVGGKGCITVNGEYSRATAYNLSGMETGLDNLAAGVYVAVVDGRSFKVTVR